MPKRYLNGPEWQQSHRTRRGGKPKLTEQQVRAIRADDQTKLIALAAEHGVSRSTIEFVKNGTYHKHVK